MSSQSSKKDLSGMLPCAFITMALAMGNECFIFCLSLLFRTEQPFPHVHIPSAHAEQRPSLLLLHNLLFSLTLLNFLSPMHIWKSKGLEPDSGWLQTAF